MSLFKNEVGRPSNETKRKRRIFYSVIVLIGILTVGIGSFSLYNTLTSKPIEGDEKNALSYDNRYYLPFFESNSLNPVYVDETVGNASNGDIVYDLYVRSQESNGIGLKWSGISNEGFYYTAWKTVKKGTNLSAQAISCRKAKEKIQYNNGSQVKMEASENISSEFEYVIYKDNLCKNPVTGTITMRLQRGSKQLEVEQPDLSGTNKKLRKTVVTIYFKHHYFNNLYYTFENYNKNKIGYVQKCSPIASKQTKSFNLDVKLGSSDRSSIIRLYGDSSCKNRVDIIRTNNFKFSLFGTKVPSSINSSNFKYQTIGTERYELQTKSLN